MPRPRPFRHVPLAPLVPSRSHYLCGSAFNKNGKRPTAKRSKPTKKGGKSEEENLQRGKKKHKMLQLPQFAALSVLCDSVSRFHFWPFILSCSAAVTLDSSSASGPSGPLFPGRITSYELRVLRSTWRDKDPDPNPPIAPLTTRDLVRNWAKELGKWQHVQPAISSSFFLGPSQIRTSKAKVMIYSMPSL